MPSNGTANRDETMGERNAPVAPPIGRYAPSPTGRMHAGNIFASLVAYIVAARGGGHMVLRIEDLDPVRSRQEYIDAIMRDYAFLGLTWDGEVLFQSARSELYADAFSELAQKACVYDCFCTRADLHAVSAPHRGEKTVYPGTCRHLSPAERASRLEAGRKPAQRLQVPAETIALVDQFQGAYAQQLDTDCGDFIVRRNDGAFAYQLAVVVDDAAQGVTSVVRGVDLLCSTPQQIYLQQLLGYPTPTYGHIPLLTAEKDRRLSKRDKDAGIDELLARYRTAAGILGHIAFVTGMIPVDEPCTADELVARADLAPLHNRIQIPWR